MTTICWDGATLAADTLCVSGDDTCLHGLKIWRTPAGLFGGAGDDPIIEIVLLWLRRGSKPKHRPTLPADSNFVGLLIEPDGAVVLLDSHLMPVRYFPQSFAVGSGAMAALAFMSIGKTAPEAVQLVIDKKLDPNTGGSVTQLRRLPRKS